MARLGEWWDAVPGARAAYDFLSRKWAEWSAGGASLPTLKARADAIAQSESATEPQRLRAVALRSEVNGLRATFDEWNPKLAGALQAVRNALGLGAVPVLALTLLVAAAVIVGGFLAKRAAVENALMELTDSLTPEGKQRVAELLAQNAGRSWLDSLGDVATLAALGVAGFFLWKYSGSRRA